MTRNDVLNIAVENCLKEAYSWALPAITWEDFVTECKNYKAESNLPKPYEFYYLPYDIFKDIQDSYVYAFNLDSQQQFLETIITLKSYCMKPIVDKYIKEYTDEYGYHPGYRGYEHPDNLETELFKLTNSKEKAEEIRNLFFKFLDMAGKFYNRNYSLNSFKMSVCLGVSPSTNKQTVIKNWKKYRNTDIEIDENKLKKEYYGNYDE